MLKGYRREALYVLSLSIFFLMVANKGYCSKESNCQKYDPKIKRTTVEISFDTLDDMVSKCIERHDSLYNFLYEVMEQINEIRKPKDNVKGLLFNYQTNNSEAVDCNIYYWLNDGSHKKLMSFPLNSEGYCTYDISNAFTIFLCAKNKYFKPKKLHPPSLYIKTGYSPIVNPISIKINLILSRHPELKPYFIEKGVRLVDIPFPIVKYTEEGFKKEFGIEFKKKYHSGDALFKSTVDALNPTIQQDADLKSVKFYLPISFSVTKEIIDTAELYKVKSGDRLDKIAEQFYGNYKYWGFIFYINKDDIDDPNLLKTNQYLKMLKIDIPLKAKFVNLKQPFKLK